MSTDVTDATFQAEVVTRSSQVPVVVDLWAPWCGPCKTLGPILEKVVAETQGRVALVKINVDENPQASAAFRVQSIPAVYALRNGQVVDGFIGAQPEPAVRSFVERLVPTEADDRVSALVEKGDETALREAVEIDPDNESAIVALAELLVRRGGPNDTEEALALLERIPQTAETRRVAALARVASDGEGDPLAGVESKLDGLLERVKGDEEARQEFVDLLELLGPNDPRTTRYRKALTARLF